MAQGGSWQVARSSWEAVMWLVACRSLERHRCGDPCSCGDMYPSNHVQGYVSPEPIVVSLHSIRGLTLILRVLIRPRLEDPKNQGLTPAVAARST